MSELEDIYNRAKEIASNIDSAVAIYASENTPAQFGGINTLSQIVEIEFGGSVPKENKVKFLELVNDGGGWVFVDEDNVFVGDNEGHGTVTISGDIEPKDAPSLANEFESSYNFPHEFNRK